MTQRINIMISDEEYTEKILAEALADIIVNRVKKLPKHIQVDVLERLYKY